jgi:hypothetical protein
VDEYFGLLRLQCPWIGQHQELLRVLVFRTFAGTSVTALAITLRTVGFRRFVQIQRPAIFSETEGRKPNWLPGFAQCYGAKSRPKAVAVAVPLPVRT